MKRSIMIYFGPQHHIEPLEELGIPLEVFRKKRALDIDCNRSLHFSDLMSKMLRSSDASRWLEV